MEVFLFAFAALFSVINPLGTVPVFVGLTQEESLVERARTSLLTSINVVVILLVAFFVGNYILKFFNISLNSLRIAGGLIITSSGFALLTGSFVKHKGLKNKRVQKDLDKRERFSLTPLAIPMLAGPGSISLLISYRELHESMLNIIAIIAAVFAVGLATYLILRSSFLIVKFMGASGINAISRIIGFIVIAIGIEYINVAVVSIVSEMLE